MSPQTTYNSEMTESVPGSPFETGNNPKDIITRFSADIIPFGRGVIPGTEEDEVKLPDSAAAISSFMGIALFDMTQAVANYPANSAIACMISGRVWVEIETAIAMGDDVYCRFSGRKQAQTITLDADFVAANVMDMTIDGTAMTSVTWNASHDQTMQDVCTQLTTDFPTKIATAACPGAGSRVITVTGYTNGTDVEIAGVLITLGVSQAAAVVAETVEGVADSEIGKFRNDGDTGTAAEVDGPAQWIYGGDAGEMAVLQMLVT